MSLALRSRRSAALVLAAAVLATMSVPISSMPAAAQEADSGTVPTPEPSEPVGEPLAGTDVLAPQERPDLDTDQLGPLPEPDEVDAFHVKFVLGAEVGDDILDVLPEPRRAEVAAAIAAAGAEIEPLFAASAERFASDEVDSRAGRDVALWYRVSIGDRDRATELFDLLEQFAVVEAVLPEPPMASASMPVVSMPIVLQGGSPDHEDEQLYRDSAPAGLDADFAATIAGGTGAEVQVFDVEYSWNTDHEDLADAAGARLENGEPLDPFNSTDHGTAVLGIIGAEDNGYGVTGIVPDADLALVNVVNTEAVAFGPAVDLAVANAEPGDVILIEQQLCTQQLVNGGCPPGWVPAEYLASFYDAIVAASEADIIVVQAAANGRPNGNGRDLDPVLVLPDSGSIIVGAGSPSSDCTDFGSEPARGRLGFSNHGARVDMQGHGACVWTTGPIINGTDPDPNKAYSAKFSGTSSASAMVAGAAASLSSVSQAAGDPLAPREVRALLRATGTPQNVSQDTQPIGPLPDLRAAIESYQLDPHPAPANDAFEAPVELEGFPARISTVTAGASVQVGEPVASCGATFSTVWFEYTPSGDGPVTVTAQSDAGSPSIAVWRPGSDETLAPVGCSAAGGQAEVDLEADRRYLLQVGRTGGEPLTVTLGAPTDCDIDRDGIGDVLVGVPGEAIGSEAEAGLVSVWPGVLEGAPAVVPNVHQNSSGIKGIAEGTSGGNDGDRFGAAVACGDFDGDGYDDAAIGIPTEDGGAAQDSGAVQVVYGGPAGLTGRDVLIAQDSEGVPGNLEADDRFGQAVAAGDVNGDGYADLVIGVPGEDLGSADDHGMVVVLFGSSTGLETIGGVGFHQGTSGVPGSPEPGDGFGEVVAAGDLTGDGFADVVVGTPLERIGSDLERAGLVTIVPGSDDGLALADTEVLLPFDSDTTAPRSDLDQTRFGQALAIADVTGDGFADLLVGAAEGERVDLFRGDGDGVGTLERRSVQQGADGLPGRVEAGDDFGFALAVGDLDGDGVSDVLIGAPGEQLGSASANADSAGLVVAVSFDVDGEVSGSSQLHQGQSTLTGAAERGDRFGAALVLRDLNADGHADAVIGVPGEALGAVTRAGMITIVDGSPDGLDSGTDRNGHQDTAGVVGRAEAEDQLGAALG